jgi:hypothetical protein
VRKKKIEERSMVTLRRREGRERNRGEEFELFVWFPSTTTTVKVSVQSNKNQKKSQEENQKNQQKNKKKRTRCTEVGKSVRRKKKRVIKERCCVVVFVT